MAQKQQPKKSKTKKPQAGKKKHGTKGDLIQFRAQLDVLGLRIVRVTADGNCFFRSLAELLEGNEEEHKKYRKMVVEFMRNHRETFEPFIEDGVPFDEYCQTMEEAGTWAGHIELQAASLVTRRNICIHRLSSPRWYIQNFVDREAKMIHLSYHDGEHYNSVRLKEDLGEGPAKPVILKVDANISADDNGKKATVYDFKASSHNFVDSGAIKLVIAGTGCESVEKIEQVLQEVGGDLDAAIEFLIAEREMIKDDNYVDDVSSEHNGDCQNGSEQSAAVSGDRQNGNEQSTALSEDMTCEHNASSSNNQSVKDHSGQKKIAQNKDCPCGSKKKHKACCGSAVKKSFPAPASKNKAAAASKSKKGTKRNQKKEATKEVSECRSANPPPDLGALCI